MSLATVPDEVALWIADLLGADASAWGRTARRWHRVVAGRHLRLASDRWLEPAVSAAGPRLRTLACATGGGEPWGPVGLAAGLGHLRALTLTGLAVSALPAALWVALEAPHLTILDVACVRPSATTETWGVGAAPAGGVPHVAPHAALGSVRVSAVDCDVGDEVAAAVSAACARTRADVRLDLAGHGLGPRGLRALGRLLAPTAGRRAVWLDVSGSRALGVREGDAAAAALTAGAGTAAGVPVVVSRLHTLHVTLAAPGGPGRGALRRLVVAHPHLARVCIAHPGGA